MKYNSDQLRQGYDEKYDLYLRLAESVNIALYKEINQHRIKIHSVTHRIKTFDSFSGRVP